MSELIIMMPDKYEGGFSPLQYKSLFDLWGMACVYQGICMYDDKFNLSNRIAEYVVNRKDYMEVKLKQLHWHDGRDITSQDFQYSFEKFYSSQRMGRVPSKILQSIEGTQYFYNGERSHISGIKIVDNKTFRIYHKAPYAYIKNLLTMPIMPEHIHRNKNNIINKYVGCGSYKLENIDDKKKAYFSRNEEFCLGMPKIEHLLLVGGTGEEQESLLRTHSLDLTIVEPEQLKRLPTSVFNNYSVFSLPQPVSTVLRINPKSEFFTNLDARKQVSQEIKRHFLVHKIFYDHAEPMFQFYPPILAQYFNCNFVYPDVAYTTSTLRDLYLGVCSNNQEHKRIAEFLAISLEGNFSVTINTFESRCEAYMKGADMYLEDMFHSFIPCSNSFTLKKQDEFSGMTEFNYLIELENKLFSDNFAKYIYNFNLEFMKILPFIPLYSRHEIQMVSKRIQHLKPDARGAFWNIHQIEKE